MQNHDRCPSSPRNDVDAEAGQASGAKFPNGAVPTDGLVAAKYQITNSTCRDTQHGFHANDLSTNQRVFLKFCSGSSQRFKNVIKMYNAAEKSKHVCKLIDMLPGTERLPPCMVFEAGDFTLAQRLGGCAMAPVEKLAMVHSILKALHDLHQRDIVHGNLNPSRIVWSSDDFCWKFTDLDFSTRFGDPIPFHQRTVTRYTAPEIRQAIEQNSISARSNGSTDMWAFGLIAFEIFTGTSILNAASVKRYIAEERVRLAEQLERVTALDAGISQRSLKQARQRLREFELILHLLADQKADRPSTMKALESNVFGVTVKPRDPMQELEDYFCGQGTLPTGPSALEKWLICYAAFKNHLKLAVSVQRFAQKGFPEVAFHKREAIKTKKFVDDYLPEYPVYVLPTGEHFRLRISLARGSRFRFLLKEVVSVKLRSPEGETQSLELWQRNEGDRLEAMALVVPSDFESPRLNTKCPLFGLVDTKYVRLMVHIEFRLGNGFPHDFDVYWPIYVQLKRRPRRFNCFGVRVANRTIS